jgi:hypothetical protein
MANIGEVSKRLKPIDWAKVNAPYMPESLAQFAAWTQQLLAKVQADMTLTAIQSAKVLLLDRFMQWQADTPKKHRLKHGTAEEPTLWYVFEMTYDKLREMELTLVPVLQPTNAPEEIGPVGILIGEQGQ